MLYSRPMVRNQQTGSRPPDHVGDNVAPRQAGSGVGSGMFRYNPPPPLVMHDSAGNPVGRPALDGQGEATQRTLPRYPGFPTPTFTFDLFPA